MKLRDLLILGLVLILLAGVNLFQKRDAAKQLAVQSRHEEWHPFIPAGKAAQIQIIRSGFPALDLRLQDGKWKVASLGGIQADAQKIAALLEGISQMKCELRAEGEKLYARFGIADAEAFRIKVSDSLGNAALDFLVSGRRSGPGVFIRLPGKQKIYSTADDLPALFGLFADLEGAAPPPIFFADLRLVPEEFENIQRFEFSDMKDGRRSMRAGLERPSAEAGVSWAFLKKWPWNPGHEKIEAYLMRLAGTLAQNIFSSSADFKPQQEIMLRDQRGKILRLQIMRRGQEWLVRREGEQAVFEISGRVYEDLKTADVLLAEENPLKLKIDETWTVELEHEGRVEKFSKASGWPSAAALMDAAMRLHFSGLENISAGELAVMPATHVMRILKPGEKETELRFYVPDIQAPEMKMVIAGVDTVFTVSRAYFETIFVPATPPV